MPIQIACPHCKSILNAPDSLAGKKIKCPKCSQLGFVPTKTEPPTTPWFVKLADGADFGPVPRTELDEWFREGRITEDCQLLKDGSDQWQWATDVYPSLAPQPTKPVAPAPSPAKIPQRPAVASPQISQTAARTAAVQPRSPHDDLDTLPAFVDPDPMTQPLTPLPPLEPLPALSPLPAVPMNAVPSNAVHALPAAPNGGAALPMPEPLESGEETPLQKIGFVIVCLPLVVCCMEMVEGWGLNNFEMSPLIGFPLIMLGGIIGGAMIGGRYFLPGAIAGFVGNLGAATVTMILLSSVNWTSNAILAIVGMLGAAPGFALYFILRWMQNLVFPPSRR